MENRIARNMLYLLMSFTINDSFDFYSCSISKIPVVMCDKSCANNSFAVICAQNEEYSIFTTKN